MATEKDPEKDIWKELVKPFPKEAMGKKPQPYKRDSPKGKCGECGGYHGLPALHLDFVSHAAITNRLNTVAGVDGWDFVPLATDQQGNPVLDQEGNLWATLTISGVRRVEVGDGNNMKDRVANALRRCAMRFGMALELWSKEELESEVQPDAEKNQASANKTIPGSSIHPALMQELRETLALKDIRGDVATAFVQATIGHPTPKSNADAQKIIDALKRLDPETGEFDAADAVGDGA